MTGGPIEYELGVRIPGVILPQSEWAKTAIKRLPEAGPLAGREPVVQQIEVIGEPPLKLGDQLERAGIGVKLA